MQGCRHADATDIKAGGLPIEPTGRWVVKGQDEITQTMVRPHTQKRMYNRFLTPSCATPRTCEQHHTLSHPPPSEDAHSHFHTVQSQYRTVTQMSVSPVRWVCVAPTCRTPPGLAWSTQTPGCGSRSCVQVPTPTPQSGWLGRCLMPAATASCGACAPCLLDSVGLRIEENRGESGSEEKGRRKGSAIRLLCMI